MLHTLKRILSFKNRICCNASGRIIISLIAFLVFCLDSAGQSIRPFGVNTYKPPKSESPYFLKPNQTARAYSIDSILSYLSNYGLSNNNNFLLVPSCHKKVIGLLHRCNEVVIFNEKGYAYLLHPEHSCINNSMLLSHNPLSKCMVDSSRTLDTFLSYLEPITPVSVNKSKKTAIIFWNFSTGIKSDDIPFDWVHILRQQDGDSMNIVLANVDVSSSWPEDVQQVNLKFLQEILGYF